VGDIMSVISNTLADANVGRKQYYCVDLFKFICALLVVSIHIPLLSSYNTLLSFGLQNCLARIAVPFFFTASGYFLFRKTSYSDFNKKVPLTYVKKIFRLYLIWTVIYFPLELKKTILSNKKGIVYGILDLVKNFIFSGSYGQLWYLNATIVATLIVALCISKKMNIKTILCLATVLYVIGLMPQTYTILLEPLKNSQAIWSVLIFLKNLIKTTRNGLFEGFLFVSIGMYFAYRPVLMKLKTAIFGFIVSLLLLLGEAFTIRYLGWAKFYDMYIFLVPSTFFMFYIAMYIELKPKAIYKHLRELSIMIFYLHILVREYVNKLLAETGTNNSMVKYCVTLLVSVIISECIIFLSHKEKLKCLKILYA
jgi:serine/alanine racemase